MDLLRRPFTMNEDNAGHGHRRLEPAEIRMILDGQPESVAELAASDRIGFSDPKGDTPLHLAARAGNLIVCDVLVRAGADLLAVNNEGLTPAELAIVEGHEIVGRLLSSIGREGTQTGGAKSHAQLVEAASPALSASVLHGDDGADEGHVDGAAEFGAADFPEFEPELDPEPDVAVETRRLASGVFVPLPNLSTELSGSDEEDWDPDLSAARISGEGLEESARPAGEIGGEGDFLVTRKRGRRARKPAVVPKGTRFAVDTARCRTAARRILRSGSYTPDDIEELVGLCRGNGDAADLRMNVQLTLEAAGLACIGEECWTADVSWDSRANATAEELAEAIETALSRGTRLPGTGRFRMDKADERRLLEPMVRARQMLSLDILSAPESLDRILGAVEDVRRGFRNSGSVTLRPVSPGRKFHPETDQFFGAAKRLQDWQEGGRVMDGKGWRGALAALGDLDLSMGFLRELWGGSERDRPASGREITLAETIAQLDAAVHGLLEAHLPYVRRFASRNVEEGEDPEDVFQVCFTGLHRASRRFDAERGVRFHVYGAFWMKQSLVRWRTDEGSLIRIPAHRHEDLARFRRATDALAGLPGGRIREEDLALELGWSLAKVLTFRRIPIIQEGLDDVSGWDIEADGRPQPCDLEAAENRRLVAEALASLDERHGNVLRMRFGIGNEDERTLEEIGRLYGVTRERIRQIETNALRALGHPSRLGRLAYLFRD